VLVFVLVLVPGSVDGYGIVIVVIARGVPRAVVDAGASALTIVSARRLEFIVIVVIESSPAGGSSEGRFFGSLSWQDHHGAHIRRVRVRGVSDCGRVGGPSPASLTTRSRRYGGEKEDGGIVCFIEPLAFCIYET
jgi:hypothetical protein